MSNIHNKRSRKNEKKENDNFAKKIKLDYTQNETFSNDFKIGDRSM